jgi:hypothetical protein
LITSHAGEVLLVAVSRWHWLRGKIAVWATWNGNNGFDLATTHEFGKRSGGHLGHVDDINVRIFRW